MYLLDLVIHIIGPSAKSEVNSYAESITVSDFGGITISPVVSKVFELCIFDRCGVFFNSSDNQFVFKKGLVV